MNILKGFKAIIYTVISRYRQKKASIAMTTVAKKYAQNRVLPPLTQEEKNSIKDRWGAIIPDIEMGYLYFQIFKERDKFDSRYLPSCYYRPYITNCLNPLKYAHALSDKNIFGTTFPNFKQPKCFVRDIDGLLLDEANNIISFDQAVKHIYENTPLIIKQSIDSCGGRNILIIKSQESLLEIESILKAFKHNYVVQELVSQSSFTKRYNPSSLNTIRITTLLLNGKFSICNAMLKCGSEGSIVDNGGAGGITINIDENGKLEKYASSFMGEIFYSSNGVKFENEILPNYDLIKKSVEEAHLSMPLCGIIGWDIALDESNTPILIEANLTIPGVFGVQICCGNMFGERTDEVIAYVKNHSAEKKIFFT